jgi:hypothetical protein
MTNEEQIKDLISVVAYVIEKSQIETIDAIRAAMNRLRTSVTSLDERSVQTLMSLKDRRSKLIPERFRLADHKRDLDSVVARLAITDRDADGFEVASNVTPTQRAEAKHRADQITAKYETRCKQLADVEAAIAAYEKEAA